MPGSVRHARIDGDRRVRQLLSEMADRTVGVEAAWPGVSRVLARHLQLQFDTEGVHLTGRPWAPLSPRYLAWKIRNGLDPRKLRATGSMERTFTGSPFPIEVYGPTSARFGSDDPKAKFHQSGTRFMPQRRILEVDANPDVADDVNGVLARYIFENRLA